jgi:hypothetical protein
MVGKYDFNKRDVPYSAIVAAFSDVVHQVRSRPHHLFLIPDRTVLP